MADKNKLYITISDNRGGGDSVPTPQPDGGKSEKKKEDTLGRYIEHQVFHLVKQQAQAAVNFALGNIGNFTGDYFIQTRINEARKNVSGFMNIGMMTVAGAQATGSWVGAVVGFAVGSISQISSGIFDTITKEVENRRTNYEISQLRERAGLNTTLDGSRGTEN